jgi:ribosomal-protein-alanine N-acetyltransferase
VPAHARRLFTALSDAELYRFLDIKQPASIAALEAQYQLWGARRSPDGSQHWLNWAARLRDEDGYAGWFQSTTYADGNADIAYMVFAPHQRHGFGREACERMIDHLATAYRIAVVRAFADPRNLASIGLALSLGMRRRAMPAENGDAVCEMELPHKGQGRTGTRSR